MFFDFFYPKMVAKIAEFEASLTILAQEVINLKSDFKRIETTYMEYLAEARDVSRDLKKRMAASEKVEKPDLKAALREKYLRQIGVKFPQPSLETKALNSSGTSP